MAIAGAACFATYGGSYLAVRADHLLVHEVSYGGGIGPTMRYHRIQSGHRCSSAALMVAYAPLTMLEEAVRNGVSHTTYGLLHEL